MGYKSLVEQYEDLKDRLRQGADSRDLDAEIVATADQHRLKDDAGELNSGQFAQVLRRMEVHALAARVFGDADKARTWLSRPNKSLSGQIPADLLKDELGAAVVRETLEQIDHGIFA